MTSDRTFGLVFGCFFSLLGGWPLIHRHPVKPLGAPIRRGILSPPQLLPRTLKPLNLLWTRFGKLLGKVTNPIFSALIFYLVFAPAGLVFRLFGKDLLTSQARSRRGYLLDRSQSPRPGSAKHGEPVLMSILTELWAFVRTRRKYWLVPMIILLAIFGALLFLAGTSVIGPFIYTLF